MGMKNVTQANRSRAISDDATTESTHNMAVSKWVHERMSVYANTTLCVSIVRVREKICGTSICALAPLVDGITIVSHSVCFWIICRAY